MWQRILLLWFCVLGVGSFLTGCVAGCVHTQKYALNPESQLKLRTQQSKVFRAASLRAVMYAAYELVLERGYVLTQQSADSLSAQRGRASLSVIITPAAVGGGRFKVRVVVRQGLKMLQDPKWYQGFFVRLEQKLFSNKRGV